MTLSLPIAFLIPIIGGFLFLCAFWPQHRSLSAELPVIVPLGAGLGLGLFSMMCFVWLVSFGPSRAYFALEVVGLAALFAYAARRIRTGATAAPHSRGDPQDRGGHVASDQRTMGQEGRAKAP